MIRVTDVLGNLTEAELLRWMLNTPKAKREQISQEARDIGHVVENIIYANIRGVAVEAPISPLIISCINGWQKFKVAKPLFCSQVTGIQGEYTDGEIIGHPDLEVTDERGWGIVDCKASGAVYPTYWTQTAKYADLKMRSLSLPPPAFLGILRLDKKLNTYDYQEVIGWKEIQYEIGVFNNYLGVYKHSVRVRERLRLALEQESLNAV